MSATFLLELGECFCVVLGGILAEPVEMGFPVGASLGSRGRPCDIPDRSAIAAQLEILSALDSIQNARGFAIQLAHRQHFHVRHDKPDTGLCARAVLMLCGANASAAYSGCGASRLALRGVTVTPLPEFQFLLDFAEGAGGGVGFSVLEDDEVLAFEHGLKFLDLIKVDDDGAADAQELSRGEMGFQGTHGFAQNVIFFADVDDGVFAGGFDGLDLVQLYEGDFSRGFDS